MSPENRISNNDPTDRRNFIPAFLAVASAKEDEGNFIIDDVVVARRGYGHVQIGKRFVMDMRIVVKSGELLQNPLRDFIDMTGALGYDGESLYALKPSGAVSQNMWICPAKIPLDSNTGGYEQLLNLFTRVEA